MFSLVEWYKIYKRDLPWRETSDPYFIWLSEIILQQTRVNQGLAYYHKFISKYPTVESLAKANTDDVYKLWQGLGYYSRAKNLLFAAKQVVGEFGGKFPEKYSDLLQLKGVGEYTAAAIASISFNIPVAVVDGNVYRVLSRVFEISVDIHSTKGKKLFQTLAGKILDLNYPGTHNQAMMELGALICTPKNPKCDICPISLKCLAFGNQKMENYPVKTKQIEKRHRYFYYFILSDGGKTLIKKRDKTDIWQNLYEFPLFESFNKLADKGIMEIDFALQFINSHRNINLKISDEIKHILSHQVIHARFIHLNADGFNLDNLNSYLIVSFFELENYAMPRLITRYISDEKLKL